MHTRRYLRRVTSALGAVALATVALTAGGVSSALADTTTTTAAPATTTTAAPATTTTAAPATTTTTAAPAATTTSAAPGTTTTAGPTTTSTTAAPLAARRLGKAPLADPTAALSVTVTAGSRNTEPTGVGQRDITFATTGTNANNLNDTYSFNPNDGTAADAVTNVAFPLPASLGPFHYPATAVGSHTATLTITDPSTNPPTVSAASVTINVEQLAQDAFVATAPGVPGVDVCAAGADAMHCTMDLYAKIGGTANATGNPADSFPIWGFTTSSTALPVLPGARLVATAGQILTLNFHNVDVPDSVSLEVPALNAAGNPDNTAVPSNNGSHTYTFNLDRPGTFILEAGNTAAAAAVDTPGARQVAMGLVSELIVRPPTPGTKLAYNNGSSYDAYNQEATVALQEFDPAFNNDPVGADLGEYHPTAFFMNGHAYDPTVAVDPNVIHAAPGDTLLLRYLNMGLRERNMRLINAKQTEVARDSYVLADPKTGIANPITESGTWLTAGQVSDSFMTVPPVLPPVGGAPLSYALYDGGFHFSNLDAGGLGGILTSIVADGQVAGLQASKSPGPAVTCGNPPPTTCTQPVVITSIDGTNPAITNPGVDLQVTANFVAQTAGTTVTSGKWFLDTLEPNLPGPIPNGDVITPTAGSFSGATANVTFTIPWAKLAPMLAATPGDAFGDHIIWVQATDSANNPGQPAGDVVSLPVRDALVSSLSLSPNVSNTATGSTIAQTPAGNIAINGTATASLARYNIVAAEACVVGPSLVVPDAATVNSTCPVAGYGSGQQLSVTPGARVVNDAVLNGTVTLTSATAAFAATDVGQTIVGTGIPVGTTIATVDPNGTTITMSAAATTSATGVTVYIGTQGAPLVAISGAIPPPTLGDGKYWVFVHAQEGLNGVSGFRWGPYAYTDPTAPSVVLPGTFEMLQVVGASGNPTGLPSVAGLALDPNPNNGTLASAGNLGLFNSLQVTGTASTQASTGAQSNIALVEVFVGEPGQVGPPVTPCVGPNNPIGCASAWGTGLEAIPGNGVWGDSTSKAFSAFIPLPTFQGRATGAVPIWVHAKDTAGNWGPFVSVNLTLDTTPPVISTSTLNAAGAVTITANDPLTNGVATGITAAQWAVGGTVTPVAITPVSGSAVANIAFNLPASVTSGTSVSLQVQDGAGNWSVAAVQVKP